MSVVFYADYLSELKVLLGELDKSPEHFQTFSVHVELAVAGGLVVYETKRKKGQTDSLYFGRSANSGTNKQISREAAFAAIERFLGLGQFIALSGQDTSGETLDPQYPHCAIDFSYRKKGHPTARSMLMVFVGFNDETDALAYIEEAGQPSGFVDHRPYRGQRSYEWK